MYLMKRCVLVLLLLVHWYAAFCSDSLDQSVRWLLVVNQFLIFLHILRINPRFKGSLIRQLLILYYTSSVMNSEAFISSRNLYFFLPLSLSEFSLYFSLRLLLLTECFYCVNTIFAIFSSLDRFFSVKPTTL